MYEDILQVLSATSGWNVIITGVFSILAAWLSGLCVFILQKKATERLHAYILYYDLKSIENFFVSTEKTTATILYAEDWQKSLAYCTFMPLGTIREIYNIYIQVYDFNWRKRNEDKIDRDADKDYAAAKRNVCDALKKVLPVFMRKYNFIDKDDFFPFIEC